VKNVNWKNSRLANRSLAEEVTSLKQSSKKDIYIGSRSLIIQALNLHLLDELQLTIHPVIEGKGMRLFDDIQSRIQLLLAKTRTFEASGITAMYYHVQR
jgi:dihydrofolate reductase